MENLEINELQTKIAEAWKANDIELWNALRAALETLLLSNTL